MFRLGRSSARTGHSSRSVLLNLRVREVVDTHGGRFYDDGGGGGGSDSRRWWWLGWAENR